MSSQDYATSITVDRTPAQVFDAITDPRRWWSGEFEGPTDEVGGVFTYRYEDLHMSKQKVTELVPGKRVAWLVVEGGPTFVAAKNEWKGTRIIFDIAENGNGTELRFTHEGLIPRLECYDNCTDVWGSIIRDDLRTLIETHMPQSRRLERHVEDLHYTASFSVSQSPAEVFAAVTNPRAWWSEEIEGPTDKLGAEFDYHYQDIHRARFKITELVPDSKVVWHVLANEFNFVKDKTEWTGTDVVFEMATKGDETELRFTHVGLTPVYECYDVCSDAWGAYVRGSLRDLIATGKGTPNPVTGKLEGVLEDVASRARDMSRAV